MSTSWLWQQYNAEDTINVKDSELSKARQENAKLRAKLDDHAMLQAAVQVYKEDFNQVLLKKLFVAMLQAAVQVFKDFNQVFL